MERTTKNKMGILSLINKAREYCNEIGDYEEHFVNERFDFTIKLNNGRLEISRTVAQDYEVQPGSISEVQIKIIAQSYKNI